MLLSMESLGALMRASTVRVTSRQVWTDSNTVDSMVPIIIFILSVLLVTFHVLRVKLERSMTDQYGHMKKQMLPFGRLFAPIWLQYRQSASSVIPSIQEHMQSGQNCKGAANERVEYIAPAAVCIWDPIGLSSHSTNEDTVTSVARGLHRRRHSVEGAQGHVPPLENIVGTVTTPDEFSECTPAVQEEPPYDTKSQAVPGVNGNCTATVLAAVRVINNQSLVQENVVSHLGHTAAVASTKSAGTTAAATKQPQTLSVARIASDGVFAEAVRRSALEGAQYCLQEKEKRLQEEQEARQVQKKKPKHQQLQWSPPSFCLDADDSHCTDILSLKCKRMAAIFDNARDDSSDDDCDKN